MVDLLEEPNNIYFSRVQLALYLFSKSKNYRHNIQILLRSKSTKHVRRQSKIHHWGSSCSWLGSNISKPCKIFMAPKSEYHSWSWMELRLNFLKYSTHSFVFRNPQGWPRYSTFSTTSQYTTHQRWGLWKNSVSMSMSACLVEWCDFRGKINRCYLTTHTLYYRSNLPSMIHIFHYDYSSLSHPPHLLH